MAATMFQPSSEPNMVYPFTFLQQQQQQQQQQNQLHQALMLQLLKNVPGSHLDNQPPQPPSNPMRSSPPIYDDVDFDSEKELKEFARKYRVPEDIISWLSKELGFIVGDSLEKLNPEQMEIVKKFPAMSWERAVKGARAEREAMKKGKGYAGNP
jgi:hypothetical protein